MICPEVVEWMHRYVDHDLNEEESLLLFGHLRHCEDCAEKFELLQKLSAQLDELPLVVPKYSIVDAILPRLDAIDRERQEEESAAEEMSPVVSLPVEFDPNRRTQRKPSSRRGRLYKTGALGTVAAAVILGIFITQYEPQTIPNAEMKSTNQSNSLSFNSLETESSSGDQAAYDGASMDKIVTEDSVADTGKGDNALGGNDAPAEASSPAEVSEPVQQPYKADKEVPAVSGDKPKDSSREAATPSNSGDQKDSNQSLGATPSTGNSEDVGLDPEQSIRSFLLENDEGDVGTAPMAATNHWTSPNGIFQTELLDGHLYLYKVVTPEVERTLIVDQSIEGNWVNGAWSPDSKSFSYEVELNGEKSSYTIDPEKAANTETVTP